MSFCAARHRLAGRPARRPEVDSQALDEGENDEKTLIFTLNKSQIDGKIRRIS